VSKILSLLKGTKDGGSNDAIRRTATETMAHLLERNRKFELFLEEKLGDLERRSGPTRLNAEAPSSPDAGYLDYYEAAPSPEDLLTEEIPTEVEMSEPLVRARTFGQPAASETVGLRAPATIPAPPVEAPDLWIDDGGDFAELNTVPVADESVASAPAEVPAPAEAEATPPEQPAEAAETPEAAPNWQSMFGLDEGDDDTTPTEWSEESLSADDGEMGDFD